jgi:60S ribosome subunit biogenesis protein NIP7
MWFVAARKGEREILVELGESGGRNADAPELFFGAHSRLCDRTSLSPHTHKMRPLTEPETKTLFEKLATYCGKGISNLIADPTGGLDRNVFRVQVRLPIPPPQHIQLYSPPQGSRCYYVRESLANLATSVGREQLLSLGICLGKFTKTGKFRLHITSLSIIAPHARYKVWVKANGEMPFLYGGNVLKAHVGRWSEDCPEHQGVIVLSMNDTPLGFGVSARSTAEARKLDPTGVVTFRQADVGEYLREEDTLFTT